MTSREKLSNVLRYYYQTSRLKEVERTGWKLWNVRGKRRESVPEHVYGTQQLAIAIFSEFDLEIDIFKVIMMLSLHETEEIEIGDITPYSGVSEQEKLSRGKIAVNHVFAGLRKKNMFIGLIDEFNERKTPEAKFAYLCDKMECDLQAKKYSDEGRTHLYQAPIKILLGETVQKSIENGATTVLDIFIDNDIDKYEGNEVFSEMIRFLKEYQIE